MVESSEESLADLPPSAKLIHMVLKYNGPMTQKDIAAESQLSPRTVRYGLNRLESINMISERIHLQDARQHIYEIPPDEMECDTEQSGPVTAADD